MSAPAAILDGRLRRRFSLDRWRGTLVAFLALTGILVGLDLITPGPFSYFEFSYMSAGGTTLALAAMGETLVVLSGGLDLSAGAVISLVNSVQATQMGDSVASQILWSAIGVALGGLVGAVNGYFVGFVRLQPVVVTLATMFIVKGVTLLVMARPGGQVPPGLTSFFTGDAISGVLPAPIVVVGAALLVWVLIKYSRFGTGLYAVGSDAEAAQANGIPVRWVIFFTYVAGGLFYGASGLFVSAQTGAGDPLVGESLLLPIFAAVVLGGTVIGGGRGGCLGTVFGAFVLMLSVNVLLVLNISPFYSTIVEGVILILAVLGASLGLDAPVFGYVRLAYRKLRGWATTGVHSAAEVGPYRAKLLDISHPLRAESEFIGSAWRQWVVRNQHTLRFVLPCYALLVIVLAASVALYGQNIISQNYLNTILMLTAFLAVLGLGQGAVIIAGGLDLSIPWTIAFCAILLTGFVEGSALAAAWAIPAVLAVGVLIGAFNGAGVVLLGLSPIVVTLATNGILQGLALLYIDAEKGSLVGTAPSAAIWFMDAHILGFAPVVWFLVAFVVAATLLLTRTTFGRRVFAVGNSRLVAKLSGVRVGGTLMGVYMLSGFCSSLVGIMLIGLSQQAYRGMGDRYLLPSIAVVVIGGTLATGGRGHYLGIFGGALLLTALDTLFSGTTWSQASRQIILGLVVLGALLVLRERRAEG